MKVNTSAFTRQGVLLLVLMFSTTLFCNWPGLTAKDFTTFSSKQQQNNLETFENLFCCGRTLDSALISCQPKHTNCKVYLKITGFEEQTCSLHTANSTVENNCQTLISNSFSQQPS